MSDICLIQEYFNKLSVLFKEYFGDPKCKKLPFQKDTHEWLNYFYKSKVFRHVHLEFYKTNKICVLHSNIFPNTYTDFPILGFDMIAINDRVTGIFFDFTPVVNYYDNLSLLLRRLDKRYKDQKRALPEWADFFSSYFFCVSPKQEDLSNILSEIFEDISYYLTSSVLLREYHERNIKTQNLYCKGQQKNDKTFKALAAEIGKDDARLFMEKYLFPSID